MQKALPCTFDLSRDTLSHTHWRALGGSLESKEAAPPLSTASNSGPFQPGFKALCPPDSC